MSSHHTFDFGSETGQDAIASAANAKSRLEKLEHQINTQQARGGTDEITIARLNKDAALVLLELNQLKDAWQRAKPLLEIFLAKNDWQATIETCEILFYSEQLSSIVALGNGVWLAVTFPVDPQITIRMLQHVIEATPDDADGAAVAAATAAYVYHLRKNLTSDPDQYLHTMQMLTSVARQHSGVIDQADFDQWMEQLELNNPDKFLVRLRNVIDVLVQDEWWFDRDQIQSELP